MRRLIEHIKNNLKKFYNRVLLELQVGDLIHTWIFPSGEVKTDIHKTHERMVIENPEKFGLTEKDVENSREGFAELEKKAIKKGNVAITRYSNYANVMLPDSSSDFTFQQFKQLKEFFRGKTQMHDNLDFSVGLMGDNDTIPFSELEKLRQPEALYTRLTSKNMFKTQKWR